ncbi:MAG: hypothetical protein KAI28_09685 [Sphingomonadales bacterium]|nr:hypothetical protein [Sphingomonadales bacterium]
MAARKVGRSEYLEEAPINPLKNKLVKVAWVLQGGAMGLLVYETGRLYMNGFQDTDYNTIMMYAGLFFLGRFMHIGVSFMK